MASTMTPTAGRYVVKIIKLAWVGTRTENFEQTADFFRDLLGLRSELDLPGFRVLKRVAIGQGEALAELEPSASGGSGWVLHPALLDGALQTAACIGLGRHGQQPTFVPFALGVFEVFAPIASACRVHAKLTSESAALLVFDLAICATDGTVLATLRGLQARALMPTASTAAETLLFAPEWRPQPAASTFAGTLRSRRITATSATAPAAAPPSRPTGSAR